ncbi:MAG TPA: DUF2993 domain-containing protein [Cryptosporangiaceae bacterium]|nr:DUF2993 domain-containing protein [Cryptosporangiaceae bacterium]
MSYPGAAYGQDVSYGYAPPRRRTGRKVLIAFLVLLLVLAALLVVADRVAASYAGDQLEAAVAAEARKVGANPRTTSVALKGFPFLTQAVGGSFDGANIVLDDITARNVKVDELALDVDTVTVPRDALFSGDPSGVKAAVIRGTATVELAQLARAFGAEGLTMTAEGDRVRVRLDVTLRSVGTVELQGLVRPRAEGDRVWLEVDQLRAGEIDVPQSVVDRVSASMRRGVRVPLPFGLRLDAIEVAEQSVLIKGTARNVPLTR